jgi:hypothetical protein
MNSFKRTALLAIAPLIVAATAQAAGPLANCSDGVPFLWPNGGQNITWNADLGDLGELTKAEADAFVATSFAQWTNVVSATISYAQGANLPVDVDETNFMPFLEATAPDGLSAIVYDDTGAIFELLFGVGQCATRVGCWPAHDVATAQALALLHAHAIDANHTARELFCQCLTATRTASATEKAVDTLSIELRGHHDFPCYRHASKRRIGCSSRSRTAGRDTRASL